MTVFSSERFISTAAAGENWRDATRKVLAKLEKHLKTNEPYNLGFIYTSDYLAPEAANILELLRAVTGVEQWVGAAGIGVCGMDGSHIDKPGLAVMLGRFEQSEFIIYSGSEGSMADVGNCLEPWLDKNEPMLCLAHGNPETAKDPGWLMAELSQLTGGYVAGGLYSPRAENILFAREALKADIAGALFSQSVRVATSLTQGCMPLGQMHTVTRCEDHIVMELDGQRALDVLAADIKSSSAAFDDDVEFDDPLSAAEDNIHVAFPVSGSDQRDYTVRNIIGLDRERGWVAVGQLAGNGDRMMFVHRNDHTAKADLSRMLVEIRTRITREKGVFMPTGAIYISCVARAGSDFGAGPGSEMQLVREIVGDIPLAGFYANGEISNGRLYGYTAILILFL